MSQGRNLATDETNEKREQKMNEKEYILDLKTEEVWGGFRVYVAGVCVGGIFKSEEEALEYGLKSVTATKSLRRLNNGKITR